MKRKHQIVLVETNKESNIIKGNDVDYLILVESWSGKGKPQHLYVLSDDEIKEGDWYHNSIDNSIKQASNWIYVSNCKKIIATTNDKISINLGKEYHESPIRGGQMYTRLCPYPQIQQSFIEYYIEQYNKGNIITEVDVEMKYLGKSIIGVTPAGVPTYINEGYSTTEPYVYLDNTINVFSIKTSWNREEVINLIKDFAGDKFEFTGKLEEVVDKWIEQNL